MSKDTRRTFLKTVGLAVGTAGVVGAESFDSAVAQKADEPLDSSADVRTATDWPTYRYDAENGGFSYANAPKKRGLPDWRKPLDTESMAAIVDGVAYLTGRTGQVVAYDLDDRTERWRVSLVELPCGEIEARSWDLAPTVADGAVYTHANGTVYALDTADGSVRWQHHVTDGDSQDVISLSPTTVTDGTVCVAAQYGAQTGFYALDVENGDQRWYVGDDDVEGFAPAVSNGVVYVVGTDIYALDLADGSERWRYDQGYRLTGALLADDDAVYAALTEHVLSLSADDGTVRWRNEGSGNDHFVGALGLADGTLYAPDEDRLYAFDAQDGTQRWETYLPGLPAELAVTDDTVYVRRGIDVGASEATVYAYATEDGSERWLAKTANGLQGLAVVDGAVYVTDRWGTLVAFSEDPEDFEWWFETVD
jgi:outer membrane protein assembly factor BamB